MGCFTHLGTIPQQSTYRKSSLLAGMFILYLGISWKGCNREQLRKEKRSCYLRDPLICCFPLVKVHLNVDLALIQFCIAIHSSVFPQETLHGVSSQSESGRRASKSRALWERPSRKSEKVSRVLHTIHKYVEST